jgi:Cys-rich protein (TIGR01571 family)
MLVPLALALNVATAQRAPNGVEPQDEPLRCAFRPPQETAVQSKAMEAIYETAATESAAARPWALSYMGSPAVRSRLHASLRHYSDEQLLQMFAWEFERLPIFHNAPLDSFGETLGQVRDDTPLNVSLDNQYLQNTCQRYVLGGPESFWSVGLGYSSMFIDGFGLSPDTSAKNGQQCVFTSSLRSSNDCLLYNANNLYKFSGGNNIDYGSVTYLLNRKTMRKRLLWEIWDGGLVSMLAKNDAKYGTVDPPAFYHLLQPHEEVWGKQAKKSGASYSIADVFNRWWVPGTTAPDVGPIVDATPYFEVMSTNVWLPEDLLAILMPYDDVWMQQLAGPDKPANYCDPSKMTAHPCFPYGSPRGQTLGDALRNWTRANNRPLIWGGTEKDPEPRMILDPYVLVRVNGNSYNRVTQDDIAAFERFWSQGSKGPPFKQMAAGMPAHLQLYWQNYNNRSACEREEADPTAMILGTDGNGDCVYWSPLPASPLQYECLNDGTCSKSSSSRAIFSTEAECLNSCAHAWECVSDIPHATSGGRRYCLPKLRSAMPPTEAELLFPVDASQFRQLTRVSLWRNTAAGEDDQGSDSFSDVHSCEAQCQPDGPVPGLGMICWNFYLLAFFVTLPFICVALCCFGIVAIFVAPHQEGEGGWSTPLHAVYADWEVCAIGTFCPCWLWAATAEFKEWRRPIGAYSKSERVLFCCTYVFLGMLIMRCGNTCFGCCTRPSLRRRLGGLKGTCKQDMAIHCCAHFCALCQEAREIKIWNQRYLSLGGPMVPLATTAPPVLAGYTLQAAGDFGSHSPQTSGDATTPIEERLLVEEES